MHDYPSADELANSLLILAALVALLLAGIMWIEAKLEQRRERERQLVDERLARWGAELEEEWQRWLREGRG